MTSEENGLITVLRNGTVKNITLSDLRVTAIDELAGGIVAIAYSSQIYNCVVDGDLSSYGLGAVVYAAKNTTILNCASFGKVTANTYASGICGEATNCIIRNCHSAVEPVSRTSFANSICSWNPRTEVTNCYGNYYKSGNYGISYAVNESYMDDDRYYYSLKMIGF